MMMFLNTNGRQGAGSFNINFEFTDDQIKLLKKYGDQITAIYYSEKNNKGKLKIQALDYPEI
jgi:hypothetical protein